MFGEDIEDPKGGVFGFTAGLSSRFPGRVVNSPLAEGTIVGSGPGWPLPVIDPFSSFNSSTFIGPGFNQLITR